MITHLPNADDYYYISNVIYYLENPDLAMGFEIHLLVQKTGKIRSVFWVTASAFDYTRSIPSYVLGIDYLVVYYLISIFLAGMLIPIVMYDLVSQIFRNKRSAVFGT